MSDLKVDLTAIQNLYPENLLGAEKVIDPQLVAAAFQGSDLKFDGKTGRMERIQDGKRWPVDLKTEAAYLKAIREADANRDGKLDLIETKKWIDGTFTKSEAAKIDPEQFLKSVQDLIAVRYKPLARNFEKLQGYLRYLPTLDLIKTYNDGILKDDIRQARSVMPLNGLTKTAGNVVGWPLYALYRGAAKIIRTLPQPTPGWFPMDELAVRMAQKRHARRAAVLESFDLLVKSEPPKNWEAGLKKLSERDRKLLTRNIPAASIHKALNLADGKQRADALKKLAVAERPGFLGYGGGLATGLGTANLFNYTGRHNNLYFARSVLAFLGNKHADPSGSIRKEANLLRREIRGDAGGFANLAARAITGTVCGTGYALSLGNRFFKTCRPTPYRAWGDEGRADFLGRLLNVGIGAFGVHKGFQAWKEAWGLRRFEGLRGVMGAWKENATWNRPVPIQALRKAKEAAELKWAVAGDLPRKPGWLAGRLEAWKEKAFKGLPPLSETQRKAVDALSRSRHKTMDRIVEGVLILAAVQASDKRMRAPYNPFETNHQLEAAPYPDLMEKPVLAEKFPARPSEKKIRLRLPPALLGKPKLVVPQAPKKGRP